MRRRLLQRVFGHRAEDDPLPARAGTGQRAVPRARGISRRCLTSSLAVRAWMLRVAIGLERTSALGSGAANTPAGRTFRRQRLCRCLDPGTLGCLAASALAGRELSFGSGRPVPRPWFPVGTSGTRRFRTWPHARCGRHPVSAAAGGGPGSPAGNSSSSAPGGPRRTRSPRRPDEADRHDLVFIGPGRLGYAWGPVGAMLAGLVTWQSPGKGGNDDTEA